MELISHSPKQTKEFAGRLAAYLQAGDVILLTGELGAGKTVFVSGLAQGLGIIDQVSSPSYVIINEYEGKINLYHIDAYRLDFEALAQLGIEEYIYGDGVCAIEWGQKLLPLMPKEFLEIKFVQLNNQNERFLSLSPQSERFNKIAREWLNENTSV